MELYWCIIVATILHSSSLLEAFEGSPTSVALKCQQVSSTKCTIFTVNPNNITDFVLELPNLQGRTILQIKGGFLTSFNKRCEKLATVRKVHLGSLGLKEICLMPELLEMRAANNSIQSVSFPNVDYKLELLDLSKNNLRNLDGFEVLVNLVELHLEDNELENISWLVFENMTNLQKLYLNGNQLISVTTDKPIDLPLLEYISLANNNLLSLDVTKWNFESLIEFDISSNSLSDVVSLKGKFPSSQAFLLANNKWHCKWLEDILEHFNETYVTVKDQDNNCEGIKPTNICCTPEDDTISMDSESQSQLEGLEARQRKLRTELETKFTDLKTKNEKELSELINQWENLKPTLSEMEATTSANSSQYDGYKRQLNQINSTASYIKNQMAQQQAENTREQLRLGYTILELRNSLEKVKKTIGMRNQQFEALREHVHKNMKKNV